MANGEQTVMETTHIGSRLQVPSGELEPLVRRTLNRIDAIHAILDVPQTPVVYTANLQPFGAYIPEREDVPRHFELSRSGPHPQLTLTHEIGHFLDHALGAFGVYLSSEPVSVFSSVKAALENSQAILNLRTAIQLAPGMLQSHRFQLLYWLNPQEQWARAYAQFIGARSGDAEFLQNIESSRDMDGPSVFRNVQWEYEDFAPIASAIEAAFQQLGWMP